MFPVLASHLDLETHDLPHSCDLRDEGFTCTVLFGGRDALSSSDGILRTLHA